MFYTTQDCFKHCVPIIILVKVQPENMRLNYAALFTFIHLHSVFWFPQTINETSWFDLSPSSELWCCFLQHWPHMIYAPYVVLQGSPQNTFQFSYILQLSYILILNNSFLGDSAQDCGLLHLHPNSRHWTCFFSAVMAGLWTPSPVNIFFRWLV